MKRWLRSADERLSRFDVTALRTLTAPSGEYEIDAVAEFEIFGGAKIVVLVECKHHKSAIKRDVVMLLDAKVRELGAHKGIVFATTPYQSGALKFARAHGIATILVVDGKTTYQTKSEGPSSGPPPWLNLPPIAAWFVSLTPEEYESRRLLDDRDTSTLASWLATGSN